MTWILISSPPYMNLSLTTKDRQFIEHIGAGGPYINLNFSGRGLYIAFTNGS
ncbi:hypothetical protein [Bacteroides pyogenes]|uniref:hypothetical protein n=1 Tax=Bacteroides pyogenes TaxID=310300 RepID=UPI001F44A4A6|nr:hypothetical protein [Bacteroides pyogenes]MCE9107653.1 hypothetical protein [Bacteroides pyogenes]